MKKNDNILTDEQLRAFLQGSKLKSGENLEHRIMQQIKTEESLKTKKVKSSAPLLRSITKIAVVFYVLALILGIATYYLGGFEAFASKEFIVAAIGIVSTCSVYALSIILDEKRYLK